MSTDLTFLTNEAGNTLADRFHALLKDSAGFDSLVGYFYLSGFHRLYPALERPDKIRILIGLQTDAATRNMLATAQVQAELDLATHAEATAQVNETVLREIETAEDSADVETGVRRFVAWIRSGKLEIRAVPSANVHAKVYIFTFGANDRDRGRVITGSSNLSQNGLAQNLEFNVELKNVSDYTFALDKFNELWKQAVPVSDEIVATVDEKSPFARFTPYELYLKFLYEYFRGEINRTYDDDDVYLPDGFRKLRYQQDAVATAKRMLEEYGGVFLADVVGLGKTYMSALLAQQLNGRSLVIAPPALLDKSNPGSWPNVFREFGVRGAEFVSIGKLAEMAERDLTKYTNVFVDESHRFRTGTNMTYAHLATICRGKKVVLVSATPYNNRPSDILSQVALFQNKRNSDIPNVRNLEAFFKNLDKQLSGLDRQNDRDLYFETVRRNANAVRERVLKYVMVRRTRSEIARHYGDDLTAQGLRFPAVSDPEPMLYVLDAAEDHAFMSTLRLLSTQLTYARYQPFSYYTGAREADDTQVQGERNLATFMKVLLIKRMESSLHAFRLTLARFIKTHEQFINEFERGNVYISKKHSRKIFELLEAGDEDAVAQLIDDDKAERYPATAFQPRFIQNLRHDLDTLYEVHELWKPVKRDAKWNEFKLALQTLPRLKESKLLIFTESTETAEYLSERIRQEVEPRVIAFAGGMGESQRAAVLANFDPRTPNPRDDYRILVTTDALAEGVSLHRANVVVNYDIPWNPTRMIQRVGRVNRVDTPFEEIFTFNYFPSAGGEAELGVRAAAEAKISAFIEMLGNDSRLLSGDEDIVSHELFARLNSRRTLTGEEADEASELDYLKEIRAVRDEQPALFSRIKRLPKKARATHVLIADADVAGVHEGLLTYFRLGKLDKFFVCQSANAISNAHAPQEIDFLTAAGALKTNAQERAQPIPKDFYALLDKNKLAFALSMQSENQDTAPRAKDRTSDNQILRRLKTPEMQRWHGFTEDDLAFLRNVRRVLGNGSVPVAISKKIAALLSKTADPLKVLTALRNGLPAQILEAEAEPNTTDPRQLAPREIILSSCLIKDI